jgi:hypothetical protein
MSRSKPVIISMCDLTGNWARPYLEAGCRVILIDPKHGDGKPWRKGVDPRFEVYPFTIQHFIRHRMNQVHGVVGILFAPPCDDFAASGSRWWPRKDRDGSTRRSLAIVRAGLQVIGHYQRGRGRGCEHHGSLRFWALENPKGRLPRLIPQLRLVAKFVFQPFWYGDAYSKWTVLYGEFNTDLRRREVSPEMYESRGSRSSRLWYEGGKVSQGPDAVMKQKELKSVTPLGFARAFFRANRP